MLLQTLMPTVTYGGGNKISPGLGDEVVQLMPLEIIVLFSIVFVIIGFARGVRAEVWSTTFILIGFVVLQVFNATLITWANRFYKLVRFGLAGGIISDNPVEIWQEFAEKPPIIESDTEKLLFRIAVFVGIYLIGFVIGRWRMERQLTPVGLRLVRELPDLGERLFGAMLGGVNGFLIAFFVLPKVLPAKKETVIVVPETNEVAKFMSDNLVNAAFIVVVVIIVLGLMASGGLRQKG